MTANPSTPPSPNPADQRAPVLDAEQHAQQSERSLAVVRRMEQALGANSNTMADHFHPDFRWVGNTGCGVKPDLASFRRNWQLPIRAAFTDRQYITERFLADGEWVSCFGHIEATHSGTFMGIAATGKRVTISYMDFWQIKDDRIIDNRVSVDFASVLKQLNVDAFAGEGWEAYDRGERVPPAP